MPTGDLDTHSMIYVETRNILIFVGEEMMRNVVIYDIGKDKWRKLKDIRVSVHDEFDLGIIATRDGRYIILFIQTFMPSFSPIRFGSIRFGSVQSCSSIPFMHFTYSFISFTQSH